MKPAKSSWKVDLPLIQCPIHCYNPQGCSHSSCTLFFGLEWPSDWNDHVLRESGNSYTLCSKIFLLELGKNRWHSETLAHKPKWLSTGHNITTKCLHQSTYISVSEFQCACIVIHVHVAVCLDVHTSAMRFGSCNSAIIWPDDSLMRPLLLWWQSFYKIVCSQVASTSRPKMSRLTYGQLRSHAFSPKEQTFHFFVSIRLPGWPRLFSLDGTCHRNFQGDPLRPLPFEEKGMNSNSAIWHCPKEYSYDS